MVKSKIFYSHCDSVLRKHLEFQNKFDSRPENLKNPTFIEVCEEIIGKYDIEYFRAIFYELKSQELIAIAVNHTGVDEAFFRNILTEKGFNFAKTKSFLDNYRSRKLKNIRNEIFIFLGMVAAIVSAVYSGLTYYREANKMQNSNITKMPDQAVRPPSKSLPQIQLEDSLIVKKK